ncbi:MAG: RIP metalloprotease RseP [candidate division WOR-3 bacterium]
MLSSAALVVLFIGVLITIHEFGHLIAAKLAGITVEVFSLGFGPVLVRRKLGGTEYRLALIPLGGFIKMVGEEGDGTADSATGETTGGSYANKPTRIRVGVIAAGPLSNLVLGFVLMLAVYLLFGIKYLPPVVDIESGSSAAAAGLMTGDTVLSVDGDTVLTFEQLEDRLERKRGQPVNLTVARQGQRLNLQYFIPTESSEFHPLLVPVVERVRSGSPAARLGLRPGDRLVSIDGRPVSRWEEFVAIVTQHGGERIAISWLRNGITYSDSVTPILEKDPMSNERFGQIGIWVRLPRKNLSLFMALVEASRRTFQIVTQTLFILGKVATGKLSTRAIGGPITVAKVAYEGASWGAEYFFALWALLSINLFVVNMLPIPVMDGGRILLDLFTEVRGRRLSHKELTWVTNLGWVIIGLIIPFALSNDIRRLVNR